MKYDVIIVGAGPAGLFSAYELITNNKKLKIALVDKGSSVAHRVCPMNKKGVPCQNCNPCAILSGYGGAGTFSDGKLNYIYKLGKSDLSKYMLESEATKLIDETEEIFNQFKMDAEVYPTNMKEAEEIRKKVAIAGARLLIIKQKHLGSDHLPEYIDGICDYLTDKGVTLIDRANVTDIHTVNESEHEVTYVTGKKETKLKSKYVIVAPGRTGAKWIQELADKYEIPYISQSIEIGVRVEVRKDIMEDLTNVIYDPTIFIKTKTYSDEIRTFCTNPGGFVAKENYYGYICVNGHALKDTKSNNTNFAFISKVNLTEPVTNTRLYGESIAKIANVLGDGKPIVQTLKDLRNAIAHNAVVFDTRFRNIEPTKAMKQCLMQEMGLSYMNFKTIGDYIILMAYYMVLLNVPRTEIKAFLREFENITDKYRNSVNTNVSAIAIHPDLGSRISMLRNYVLTH